MWLSTTPMIWLTATAPNAARHSWISCSMLRSTSALSTIFPVMMDGSKPTVALSRIAIKTKMNCTQ